MILPHNFIPIGKALVGSVSKRIGKVAVIGGGLAGLACAKLLSRRVDHLAIYDENWGPGVGNASAAAVSQQI